MKKLFLYIIMVCLGSSMVAQDSLHMRVLYNWQDPSIPPAPWIENPFNEIWGWYDSVQQREYAIIGSANGTHIFDITEVKSGIV
ncbi:MAG: hypothetical protein AAFV07_21400, partial [Bacteroidota bacterium]